MTDATSPGPVFVVGMPRSGTKLLVGLLNQHPLIAIPPAETEFLPWLAENWTRFGDIADPAAFAKFYREMSGHHYFRYMASAGPMITEDRWYETCPSFTPAGVFEALIRHDVGIAAGEPGIWGDKSPSYIGHIALLKDLYPTARVIHIVRDVRDYCLSINKAWGKNMLRAAQRWTDSVQLVETSRQMYPDAVVGVRYEDLLDDPETELRRLCGFLGVVYDPAMGTLRRSVENVGDARGMGAIKRDNKHKFVHSMAPGLRSRIEAVCWPMLDAWGYEHEYAGQVKRVPPLKLKVLQGFDALNLLRFHIGEQGFARGIALVAQLFLTSGNRLSK